MSQPNVTVYSTTMCPYCVRAKQLLTRKNIEFEEILIDASPEARDAMLKRTNGARTVPQIFIGDTHVGGSDDLYTLEKSGKLDALIEGGA